MAKFWCRLGNIQPVLGDIPVYSDREAVCLCVCVCVCVCAYSMCVCSYEYNGTSLN